MKRFKAGDVVVITKPPFKNWEFSTKLDRKNVIGLVGEIGIIDGEKPLRGNIACIHKTPNSDFYGCDHSSTNFITTKIIQTKYIKKIGVL